ncbi:glycosyltransferase family 2 protein [Merdimonas faecis]|uniref:glycosyltransferase family 2 protein n=1 Tax=Merdimonas faecis TaxID=1653435 RepID=UPI0023F6D997|nr:glycosyltransferase family 2 protein [Merdimonas faecis]
MDISVVVPVYGCRAALEELYSRLTKTLNLLVKEYEIILVNDNCPQNSWEIIEKICAEDSHVVGIELARNFGQIQAITAGLDYSSGDWVVVMDCDLQDRPEEIANLYNKAIEGGYDAVFARRKNRKDSPLKVFVSKLFYKIYSWASGGNYDPAVCNFSISKRIVIDNYCKMRELHRAFVIYVKWLGFKITTLDVEHDPRKEGKSSYNMKKRIKMAIEILTSQSDKLLRLTINVGFFMVLCSIVAIIAIIIQYFVVHVNPGWSSIIATICLVGGMIISSIGVVGVYIGNIFMQVKERPLYVVRTVLNKTEE